MCLLFSVVYWRAARPPVRWVGPRPRVGYRAFLRAGADALFVDGVVGVPQQYVGEAGLQQVHGQEGGLLHDLDTGGTNI